jgi:hypothetical protein
MDRDSRSNNQELLPFFRGPPSYCVLMSLKVKAPKNRATDLIWPESRLLLLPFKVAPTTSYFQYNKNGQKILFNPETEKLYFTNPTRSKFRFTLHYSFLLNLRAGGEQNMNLSGLSLSTLLRRQFSVLLVNPCSDKYLPYLFTALSLSRFFVRINQIHLRGFTTE